MTGDFTMRWDQAGAAIAAIGSLGVAAFGVTESLGKAMAWRGVGLPYVGLRPVKRMMRPLRPALEVAYGVDYDKIVTQQYRSGRSAGQAPDTIRQGVRLGLPFLGVAKATALIAAVWHMEERHAVALATALQAPDSTAPTPVVGKTPPGPGPGAVDEMQALAGRFATALDARVNAAFTLAEEQYESVAKTSAGAAAIALALLFNWGLGPDAAHPAANAFQRFWEHREFPWAIALGIGIVAVPLAPVAKDLSSSLQSALTAFKSISGKQA
jgi:hypothetical protein